jgi:transcriptional regulator GlxA family with amidase domain
MAHTVAFVVHPGFPMINLCGPVSVFDGANFVLRRMMGRAPVYAVEVISPAGGLVMSEGAVAVRTRALARLPATRVHTALFVGADLDHLLPPKLELSLRRWATRCASVATRIGAICTGAFVLAALGLLEGKRAATHWLVSASLAEKYPSVTVDAESLYVVDGNTWTSAGSTAGIDMALAMVSRDLGNSVADLVAKG